jgi:hypothetical protein
MRSIQNCIEIFLRHAPQPQHHSVHFALVHVK